MRKIYNIQQNEYTRPDNQKQIIQRGDYITNDEGKGNNEFFYTVEKCYLGSPTNAAIIDNYTNYIVGEGLFYESGDEVEVVSKSDIRLAVKDYKIQGQCAFQVIYNFKGEIVKLYHIPIKQLAVNREEDIIDEVTGYWYSFDWRQKYNYKPTFISAFGKGDGVNSEIKYIKSPSEQPVYSLPDWISGIQYCEAEEELSNYYINHIKNSFSVGTIININQGSSDSEEAEEEARNTIIKNLTGTNGLKLVVSFNDNKENATEVTNLEIPKVNDQYKTIAEQAREMIMLSHKINDPGLFGFPNPNGFSSDAEKMDLSLKQLYRNQINPIREVILDGLEDVLGEKLEFRDFEEFRGDYSEDSGEVINDEEDESIEIEDGELRLKKWRSRASSSNVNRLLYNDEIKELVIEFRGGDRYTYSGVDMSLFLDIVDGAGICRTSGSNKWGSWYVGKFPSVGAAVYTRLVEGGVPYRKGGSLK